MFGLYWRGHKVEIYLHTIINWLSFFHSNIITIIYISFQKDGITIEIEFWLNLNEIEGLKYLFTNVCYLLILEIKPCWLGSRIWDVEAFWYKTEIKIIYFVWLCVIVWFTLTLNFWYLTIQSDTINTIKHNGTKQMILISVLYQNASTSRILEPSPQGLISSISYF